jgi:hypothetical protein
MSIRETGGRFIFDDHMEQTEDWQDALLVDIEPPDQRGSRPQAWAAWNSSIPTAIRDWAPDDGDKLSDTSSARDFWSGEIRVPEFSRRLLGDRAGIRLTVTPRSVPL